MNRRTSLRELGDALAAAGFEKKPCAHRGRHASWEYRPMGGRPGSMLPLYVVHVSRTPTRVVVSGFAYGGPKDTDEHWRGAFASLTAAADFAERVGRRPQ